MDRGGPGDCAGTGSRDDHQARTRAHPRRPVPDREVALLTSLSNEIALERLRLDNTLR
jgi:hypothetical protein